MLTGVLSEMRVGLSLVEACLVLGLLEFAVLVGALVACLVHS